MLPICDSEADFLWASKNYKLFSLLFVGHLIATLYQLLKFCSIQFYRFSHETYSIGLILFVTKHLKVVGVLCVYIYIYMAVWY